MTALCLLGPYGVSVHADRFVRLWDGATGRRLAAHQHKLELTCIAADSGIVAVGDSSGSVHVYGTETDFLPLRLPPPKQSTGTVHSVAVVPQFGSGAAVVAWSDSSGLVTAACAAAEPWPPTQMSRVTLPLAAALAREGSAAGVPLPGVGVKVLDADGAEVAPGEPGELCASGRGVMRGYWKNPEATAEVLFEDGGETWFRTGDQCVVDAAGHVRIVGRIKEQYKLANGKYVVPTPLEEQLARSRYVAQAFLYGDNRPYNVVLLALDWVAVAEKFGEAGSVAMPAPYLFEPAAAVEGLLEDYNGVSKTQCRWCYSTSASSTSQRSVASYRCRAATACWSVSEGLDGSR